MSIAEAFIAKPPDTAAYVTNIGDSPFLRPVEESYLEYLKQQNPPPLYPDRHDCLDIPDLNQAISTCIMYASPDPFPEHEGRFIVVFSKAQHYSPASLQQALARLFEDRQVDYDPAQLADSHYILTNDQLGNLTWIAVPNLTKQQFQALDNLNLDKTASVPQTSEVALTAVGILLAIATWRLSQLRSNPQHTRLATKVVPSNPKPAAPEPKLEYTRAVMEDRLEQVERGVKRRAIRDGVDLEQRVPPPPHLGELDYRPREEALEIISQLEIEQIISPTLVELLYNLIESS